MPFPAAATASKLAVPFSIDDKQARAAFTSWASSSSYELQSLRPEYLPMYFFRGCLRATYTGVIRGHKGHETRAKGLEIEEQQVGIGFDHSTGDWRTARVTGVYAGLDYPPWYVEEALLTGGGEASGMPLSAANAPPTTRVGAFAMNPAFAYDLVHVRLGAVADAAATTAFLAKSAEDDVRVEDVKHELHLPSLADGGVLLMPCFVCEYTFDGEPYSCFVSGINGQLIGMTHTVQSFLYRTIGGSIGLLIGACVVPYWGSLNIWLHGGVLGTPVAQAVVGAVVGTLIGHMSRGRLEESVMAERFAKLNAERHQKWLAKLERDRQENKKSEGPANEAFWQAEVDRVRADVLPAGDARLVAGLASPPPGLEQDQMLRNLASLALSAKVRLQVFERYEQPPSTPAAQPAAQEPGSPSAGLTAVEFTDQEGDRSKLLVSGGKLQWHANGRVESRNVTALQLSEEGGVQTISAPALPKINLGESQLREQIDEARERTNEQLPRQIATFLFGFTLVAFSEYPKYLAERRRKESTGTSQAQTRH